MSKTFFNIINLPLFAALSILFVVGPTTVSHADPAADSFFIMRAGDNAKAFFYKAVQERSDYAKQQGALYSFQIMDARDPRLYAPGAPIQPITPADTVL